MNIHKVTFILLVIGGLNWGLEAVGFGVGSYLPSGLAMTIYILVGLAALYEIFAHKKLCRSCNSQGSM
jgi:uncharacterized membrane protein YuzA (DUF378 family)